MLLNHCTEPPPPYSHRRQGSGFLEPDDSIPVKQRNDLLRSGVTSRQHTNFLTCVLLSFVLVVAWENVTVPATFAAESEFFGRWDLTLLDTQGYSAAWLEILPSSTDSIQGRLVWLFGGAEPLADITIADGVLTFHHPFMGKHLIFTAWLNGSVLQGTTSDNGSSVKWIGVRAPELQVPSKPLWGAPVILFNGHDLSGWSLRNPRAQNCWHAQDGILYNDASCVDLKSTAEFLNFRLHLEFRLEGRGGSGVYLRGRYEVQIADDAGKSPNPRSTGAIFGYISPSISAGKPQGKWQTLNITLLGRMVTVELNDRTVIAHEEIPGITGAALDSHEAQEGPIMLQGDHGRISFRNIILTPGLK
jgi:Domain of Unknown Function (DUF1080)